MPAISEACVTCELAQYELFRDLTPTELNHLERSVVPAHVQRRTYVFTPGQAGENVYLIHKGRVRLSRVSAGGREHTLGILEAGSIVGEDAIFHDGRYRNFAEAMDDVEMCAIPKEDFERALQSSGPLSLALARSVEERLSQTEEKLEEIVFLDVHARLARLLLKLADTHGVREGDVVRVNLRLTHEEIATMIGSTRETTSKLLGEFRAAGYIDTQSRYLFLLDQRALAEF